MEDVQESSAYSFPKEEEVLLEHWRKTNAFKEQLRRSEEKPEFIFYDGPPFATGLPHYGHLLAGSLKARSCGQTPLACAVRSKKAFSCAPAIAGYRHTLCQPDRAPRSAALWLGLSRFASRV